LWGRLGVGVFAIGLVGGAALLLLSAARIISQPDSAPLAADPQNLLVIPGVNQYLPLDAAPELGLALLFAMVIHELGHAIYCRVGDIEIESSGLALLSLLPAGAFVEPNEASQEDASRWHRIQMVSAGVMNNVAAVAVGLVVLLLVVPSIVSTAPGVAVGGVLPNSPAADAGLADGDRIVAVDGTPIETREAFQSELEAATAATVTLRTADDSVYDVTRRVFISGSAISQRLPPGTSITNVEQTPVSTTSEFEAALKTADSPTVSLTTTSGDTVAHVAGVRTRISQELAIADAIETDVAYLTVVDGQRTLNAADLSSVIESHTEGDTIPVRGVMATPDGFEAFQSSYTVTEGTQNIAPTSGIGGVSTVDIGVEYYPADTYLGYLTGEQPFASTLVLIMFLPFATLLGLPYNFAGFTSDIVGFYEVAAPLSPIAPLVLFGVSFVYWTVWVNVNLALFNCLPTFALDGGHYARYAFESAAARLGAENPKQASAVYARGLMMFLLSAIAVVVVLPPLLG
jgi:membrane-associated protease RseP (regulator of RpoE activity)